jgi:hypothetical protein
MERVAAGEIDVAKAANRLRRGIMGNLPIAPGRIARAALAFRVPPMANLRSPSGEHSDTATGHRRDSDFRMIGESFQHAALFPVGPFGR